LQQSRDQIGAEGKSTQGRRVNRDFAEKRRKTKAGVLHREQGVRGGHREGKVRRDVIE
jgi:hypothetical protein